LRVETEIHVRGSGNQFFSAFFCGLLTHSCSWAA